MVRPFLRRCRRCLARPFRGFDHRARSSKSLSSIQPVLRSERSFGARVTLHPDLPIRRFAASTALLSHFWQAASGARWPVGPAGRTELNPAHKEGRPRSFAVPFIAQAARAGFVSCPAHGDFSGGGAASSGDHCWDLFSAQNSPAGAAGTAVEHKAVIGRAPRIGPNAKKEPGPEMCGTFGCRGKRGKSRSSQQSARRRAAGLFSGECARGLPRAESFNAFGRGARTSASFPGGSCD